MASKNLGEVIQRAISDGAFRRQLQSDPAAALRGFNLTPDEVAAIRSADSGKLMSLGVDQRTSKAFTVGSLSGTRAAASDVGTGAASNALVGDQTAGAREGIVGDPTLAGTRSIHDDAPADLRGASTDPTLGGVRSVNDSAPFGTTGTSAVEDTSSPEFSVASRMAEITGADAVRAVHDIEPVDTGIADAAAPTNDFVGGDIQHDPGLDATRSFVPSDSADVQREMLEGIHGGDALGNTGGSGNTAS